MAVAHVDALPARLKIGWATGAAGVSVLMNGVSMVILFYLVAIVKLDPVLAGSLIFGFKILDVVTDPVMGVITDRTQSRMGRRRPYLLIGSFVASISMIVLFSTPEFDSEGATIAYVCFGLLLYTLGYTIFNVPYITMPAEMTDGYHERSSIHAYRVAFVSVGSTLGTVTGLYLLEKYGQTRETYQIIAWLKGVFVFATMLGCFFATRSARTIARTEAVPQFWTQARSLLDNRYFLLVITAKLTQLIGIFGIASAAYFFFLTCLQLNESALIAYSLAQTAGALVAAPLLVRLSRVIGKRNTYILGGVFNIAVALSWYLAVPGEALSAIMLRGFCLGIPFAGNVLLAMSMLTDTIEYDARRSGIRREGIYTAMYSFVEKFAGAFGPLIVGILLAQAGFDKTLGPKEAQSPEVFQAVLVGMSLIPAVTTLISMVIISFYKLDEETLAKAAPPEPIPEEELDAI
ncbi:MAG: MFS transporter [Congregibacter sp.]